MQCCRCGVELTDENWPTYLRNRKGYKGRTYPEYICANCLSKRRLDWCNVNRKELNQYYRDRYPDHKDSYDSSRRKHEARLKLEVLTHYSTKSYPVCADLYHLHLPNDPFLTDIDSLSLDLIKGGHRRSGIPYGSVLYEKLKKEGYPKGWQVLCFNCQWKKRRINRELFEKNPTP
jgi:hypothetical protein